MQHPPTRHGPKRESEVERAAKTHPFDPVGRYAAVDAAMMEELRKQAGPDWVSNFPSLNPLRIVQEAKAAPMHAAYMCQHACRLLFIGHHRRVREYLVAAYTIGFDFKENKSACEQLARDVRDGRFKDGVKVEWVQQKFCIIFFSLFFIKVD